MKKRTKIIISIVVLLCIGGIAGVVFGLPAYQTYRSYQSAEQLLQDGQYDEAKNAFWALGDYKDSADKMKECDYQKALSLLKGNDYAEAKMIFNELGTYEDSADKIKECDYQKAKSYLEEEKYEEAKEMFEALKDYSDSKEQIKACEYGIATLYFSEKEYEKALEIFTSIKDYEDAKEKVKECNYQIAEGYYKAENYTKAEKIYKELGSFKKSKKRLKEIVSKREQEKENRKKAKAAFKKYLSQSEIDWGYGTYTQDMFNFTYVEMGENKEPCLFVECTMASHGEGYVALMQYVNGKVLKVVAMDWFGDNENGDCVYPEAGIVPINHSGGGYGEINTYYYKLNDSGVFKEVAYTSILSEDYAEFRMDFGNDIYQIGGTDVTEVEFEDFMENQLSGKNKKLSINFKSNTAKNRKNILG